MNLSLCPAPTISRVTDTCCRSWILFSAGMQTQVLTFAWQVLYSLSLLPCPLFFFVQTLNYTDKILVVGHYKTY